MQETSEWCLPQRTGTRRYLPLMQDLFWQYEVTQQRLDRAANCARRRYDNARRLTPFCSQSTARDNNVANNQELEKEKKKKERALCRLVRHYALFLSLYHIMTLSMTMSWNCLLYCARAVGDAPIPLPSSSETTETAENYRQHVYARLHNNLKDGSASALNALLQQIEKWLSLLENQPLSVISLEENVRPEIVNWVKENVIEPSLRFRRDADGAWKVLLNYCDASRIAEKCETNECALSKLTDITGMESCGESVDMISRHKNGGVVQVCLPVLDLRKRESDAKQNMYELDRLQTALKAVGG